jgi:hypothetical protein
MIFAEHVTQCEQNEFFAFSSGQALSEAAKVPMMKLRCLVRR